MNDGGFATSEVHCDLSAVDAERLSRLWPAVSTGEPGASPSPQWDPVELAEILRLQLATPVDPRADATAAGSFTGTYHDLLFHPDPPVAPLLQVKECAKRMMSREGGELPREVAGVIYFAAVSAARLRGVQAVSELPDETLRRAAAWALRQPWLDASTTGLFKGMLAEQPIASRQTPSS